MGMECKWNGTHEHMLFVVVVVFHHATHLSLLQFVISIFIPKNSSHDRHLWQYLSTVLLVRGGLMFYSLCACVRAYRDVKKTPAGQTSTSTGAVPQYHLLLLLLLLLLVGVFTACLSIWCDNTRTWQCDQVCLELAAKQHNSITCVIYLGLPWTSRLALIMSCSPDHCGKELRQATYCLRSEAVQHDLLY